MTSSVGSRSPRRTKAPPPPEPPVASPAPARAHRRAAPLADGFEAPAVRRPERAPELPRAQTWAAGPTRTEVGRFVADAQERVFVSEAPADVKRAVDQQLERVGSRLAAGEIEPSVGLEQAKLWIDHLDGAAREQIAERVARAESIERMGPLERAHEGLIGLGTGTLKTGQGLARLAQGALELSPTTWTTNVVFDTAAAALETGDLQGSLRTAVSNQVARTRGTIEAIGEAALAAKSVADDVLTVAGAAGDAVAEAATGASETGDLAGSTRGALERAKDRAGPAAGRLGQLAADVSGLGKVMSGDPRAVGEGVFDLGLLVSGPLMRKGHVATASDDVARAANNIVPFRRPPASGVLASRGPVRSAPGGAALLLEPTRTRSSVEVATRLPRTAPPPPPAGGGGGPIVAGMWGAGRGGRPDRPRGSDGVSGPGGVPKLNGTPLDQLQPPNASRHRYDSVSESSVSKGTNTVAEPWVDMAQDAADIRAGRGAVIGSEVHVNGRIYGAHDGRLYPIMGDGLHQLDRGGFKALQTLKKFGDTPRAAEIMARQGITPDAESSARALYEAASGR